MEWLYIYTVIKNGNIATYTIYIVKMEPKYLLLEEWMFKKRISSKDLAKKVGVSYTTANSWKKGKQMPTIIMLFEIAEAMELQPSDLLNDDNQYQ